MVTKLLGAREWTIAAAVFGLAAIWALLVLSWPASLFAVVLALQLSLLLAIDARHMVLPNSLNALLALSGMLTSWLLDDGEMLGRILAIAIGFSLLALVAWLYNRLRGRYGLGLGDAKLVGALGAWVGVVGLPSLLFLAALGGLAFVLLRAGMQGAMTLGEKLPFGPFIAIAGWIVWLYGPLLSG